MGSRNEARTNAARCTALVVPLAAAFAAMLAWPVSWMDGLSTPPRRKASGPPTMATARTT